MEIHWKLAVMVQPEANGFTDVVRVVHWECVAKAAPVQVRLYGAIDLPPPADPESYVDLDAISEADETDRRAIILSWAEMLQPGFATATEAAARARLHHRQAQTGQQMLTLI